MLLLRKFTSFNNTSFHCSKTRFAHVDQINLSSVKFPTLPLTRLISSPSVSNYHIASQNHDVPSFPEE